MRVRSGANEQNCLPTRMSAVRQKKEFGRASPGLLTQVRKHANLGHPYGVATTSPAASIHCFVNLPPQVVTLISHYLANLPSRPKRSVVERFADVRALFMALGNAGVNI